jgi:hypothetical protein
VKIKSVTIQGFRGFNEEKTIEFHNRLVLIYAPNSYGKTSISEAFEWLLYGITSKVKKADSKDEYKGSYRNCHLPESQTPFVRINFIDGTSEIECRGELVDGDTIKRFVGGNEVKEWPFAKDLTTTSRPFILQHALKYLLLVGPDERFKGFALLLGLEDLDQIHRNFVSLCTKPDAAIPAEVSHLRNDIDAIGARLASQISLSSITKSFNKGRKNLAETYKAIMFECNRRVSPGTKEESVLPQLLKIRESAVGKIFKGSITLPGYSTEDKSNIYQNEKYFLSFVTEELIKKYVRLIEIEAVDHILTRAKFLNLGIKFLEEKPEECPFCGQPLNDLLSQHIHDEHINLAGDMERNAVLEKQRSEVLESLIELRKRIRVYQDRHFGKVVSLLELESSLEKLRTILTPKHEVHFCAVNTAISQLASSKKNLEESFNNVIKALDEVESSITYFKENDSFIKKLGDVLVEHIKIAGSYVLAVSNNVSAISEADQILKHELDTLAETEDISILIDLLELWQDIKKKFEIDDILESLKDFRKNVDRYVANKVLNAISGELTSEVMEWYSQIKTTGDPDVHFDGFDMERTIRGEIKARRVKIKATSYGKDLVSAVSSLSESKLNALGLCVSIATNLKSDSPFEFLIIDDPIQSWDAEHEIQFIEVIKKLIERGKQVILLSHNLQWIKQVRGGCRALNGWYYEITGYLETGPKIHEVPWAEYSQRLQEVDAIIKDPDASSSTLQRAEAEIRIAIEVIISKIWRKKKGIQKSCHNLGCIEVRKKLLECGVEQQKLIDNITLTYETTDPAHHDQKDYAPNKDRIRKYHSWTHELARLLN